VQDVEDINKSFYKQLD